MVVLYSEAGMSAGAGEYLKVHRRWRCPFLGAGTQNAVIVVVEVRIGRRDPYLRDVEVLDLRACVIEEVES